MKAGAIKKIPVQDLREGMYLHGLCGSWTQHPFWRTRFVVKDAKDIRLIIESGIAEVWIDPSKGRDVNAAEPDAPVPAAPSGVHEPEAGKAAVARPASMAEEMERAARICASASKAVAVMFDDARMGKAISGEAAGALVNEISSSVMRNPGALISLARLKTADDYTYMHSVAVCALMVALARQLGMDEAQTREAGMAGLLHDLGKALMPMDVLNKPGKLTDEEFRIIKGHPEAGHRLLVEAGNAGAATLDVCLHHHEKMDGSGYPHGLKPGNISELARMGAVCDVYDAITSNRPYKAGWDPAESIRRMTEWCGGHFDKRIFQAFVKSIGIYPVGSLVRLASGRLAVVIEQAEQSLLKPTVKAFFSTKSSLYIAPELIHLSRACGNEKILGIEDAAAWHIQDINRYWVAS